MRAPGGNLDRIFRATSVVLVGASANPRRLNGIPLTILERTGFGGRIFIVNPKYETIGEHRCYASLLDLPAIPDCALIMVEAARVPKILEECGIKGIHAAVVISSGFEEFGAVELVDEVRAICERHDIDLVGPNCEGVWSIPQRVILTFGSAANRSLLHRRPIAILSQSGSIAGAAARHLQDSAIGCNYVVSAGNETRLGVLDYLDYILAQDDVCTILLFIEALKNGDRLPALAARARERGIALIALKAGNSLAGSAAVAGHTGKIASPAILYHDIFQQLGIIEVDSLAAWIDAGEVLSCLPSPRRNRPATGGVAVFSIPGGTRSLTADACARLGVPLAHFEAETVAKLEALLPSFGVAHNPTDLTGAVLSTPTLFTGALEIIADDPNTAALIVQFANRGPHDATAHADELAALARRREIPVVISFLGDELPTEQRGTLAKQGLMCARDPAEAVLYLSWLYRSAEAPFVAPLTMTQPASCPSVPSNYDETIAFFEAIGIASPRYVIAYPKADIAALCKGLRFPVAVKALPEHADHKTEIGAIILNLTSVEVVAAAVDRIRTLLGQPECGVLIQEMLDIDAEAVLSISQTEDFGPVLAIGSGGTRIELDRDVAYLALPVSPEQIRRALSRLRLDRMLRGYRGGTALDADGYVEAASRLAAIFPRLTGVTEIEINPLIVRHRGEGVAALDVLLRRGTLANGVFS